MNLAPELWSSQGENVLPRLEEMFSLIEAIRIVLSEGPSAVWRIVAPQVGCLRTDEYETFSVHR
jgi:hypothetical protein